MDFCLYLITDRVKAASNKGLEQVLQSAFDAGVKGVLLREKDKHGSRMAFGEGSKVEWWKIIGFKSKVVDSQTVPAEVKLLRLPEEIYGQGPERVVQKSLALMNTELNDSDYTTWRETMLKSLPGQLILAPKLSLECNVVAGQVAVPAVTVQVEEMPMVLEEEEE